MRTVRRLLLFAFYLLPFTVKAQTSDQRLVDSIVHVVDSMKAAASRDSLLLHAADSVAQLPTGDTPTNIQQHPTASNGIQPTSGYHIRGIVRDKATGEGIPFANVFFPHSPAGARADLAGRFELTFDTPPSDTLNAGAMGYADAVRRFNKAVMTQELTIELSRDAKELETAVVHAGEDPALKLLKKIIARKPFNDPDRLAAYRYEVYNKLEVDIRNLTKKEFEKLPIPMIKQFGFIYNNLDTTTEKVPFLPFFLTESLSDYYFQRSPKKTKEFIRATLVKGAKNESIDPFLGAMYQSVNAYKNNILVFDKNFVSPISSSGAFYYKYKIKDARQAYGHNITLVQFAPRRSGENCFYGDFWVVDSTYALQRISMEVPADANINFVHRVSLYQEFMPLGDTLWFPVKDKFVSDFDLPYTRKLPGFIGRKTTSYRNISIAADSIAQVVNDPKLKVDVMRSDTTRHESEDYWAAVRHDTLSKNERAIYQMVDTLNNLPAFVRFKHLMRFLFAGTVKIGIVDIGPYYNVYSSNNIEGSRFRLGLATNKDLWKDAVLTSYVAYGTLDKEFKYYGSAFWILDRKPRTYLYASYRHDIDRSNDYFDQQVSADNIFANIARKKGLAFKFALVDDARFEVYREYNSGFSNMLTLQRRRFNPYAPLPGEGIFRDEEGNSEETLTHTEVGLRLRYAYKEDYLENGYYRSGLGSKYPIPELRLSMGFKNFLGGEYEYKKVMLLISDDVKIPHLGKLQYGVFAGKVWGTLPYPLLHVLPGNEFHYYNRYAFNMMNRYEFIADQVAGFNLEHQFGGGIFNYIPYLKKAKLRQFWTAKGVIGTLSDSNRALNFNKGYEFRTLEGQPYLEVGTGVENILQIFRLDFVWRVTPKPLEGEDRSRYFGIFGSVRFQF